MDNFEKLLAGAHFVVSLLLICSTSVRYTSIIIVEYCRLGNFHVKNFRAEIFSWIEPSTQIFLTNIFNGGGATCTCSTSSAIFLSV